MSKQKSIIIVAGGKGLRMGSDLPKQFIPIKSKPVLMHTIESFYNYDSQIKIILVIPSSHQAYWQELCSEYRFTIPHIIANGGETRFHSVKNGLEYVTEGLVGVQDGVRPFASTILIANCFSEAAKGQSVIPAIPSTDSLRQSTSDGKSKIIDRSKIMLVQTPQVFESATLKRAYDIDFNDTFTDDASVVEAMGQLITIIRGEESNIKITTPIDLKIGEMILDNRKH